jgi:hypothetical protein
MALVGVWTAARHAKPSMQRRSAAPEPELGRLPRVRAWRHTFAGIASGLDGNGVERIGLVGDVEPTERSSTESR